MTNSMLINEQSRDEVGEKYRQSLPGKVEKIKTESSANAQDTYREPMATITEPWKEIVNRKPSTKSTQWNFNRYSKWKELRKAKRRVVKANSGMDWDMLKDKRKEFEQENRMKRSIFKRISEEMMKSWPNSEMTISLRKNRKRKYPKVVEDGTNGELLDPAAFPKFMGTFHDENQTDMRMLPLQVPDGMKEDIEK